MNPSKEVIDAAERYVHELRVGDGRYNEMKKSFIAGDANGYSRAMERIAALESACVEIRSQMKRNDLDTLKVYGHLFKMLDQALKGT